MCRVDRLDIASPRAGVISLKASRHAKHANGNESEIILAGLPILATVMVLTRRFDWYGLVEQWRTAKPGRQVA